MMEQEKSDSDEEEVINTKALEKWTVEDVYGYFYKIEGLETVATIFKDEEITGADLWALNYTNCREMGIKFGKFNKTDKIIAQLKKVSPLRPKESTERVTQYKLFCDPIHGHLDLHPVCVKIIDTPQFQRLRLIKQLGPTYLVYTGASHNRFEHSIGVCYLAGKMMEGLRKRQPELQISDRDILCVQIAGLCHDLGHGPFSHTFEEFIKTIDPESTWKHEQASVKQFHQIIISEKIQKWLEDYGVTEDDIVFIEEIINRPAPDPNNAWNLKGRNKNKSYMYDIVSNQTNGIDVDKFDYFARDCYQLGFHSNFDHRRYMKLARVVDVNGQPRICSRDKDIITVHEMFQTRAMLHRRAYKHKTVLAIDNMILQAFIAANNFYTVEGDNGCQVKLADAIHDPVAFQHLTDNIFWDIAQSTAGDLQPARNILQNVLHRKIVKFVDKILLRPYAKLTKELKETIPHQIAGSLSSEELGSPPLEADAYVIIVADLSYGMGDKNPLSSVYFYTKREPTQASVLDITEMPEAIPENCREQYLYVYCHQADKLDLARQCCLQWQRKDPSRIIKTPRIHKDSM